MTPRAFRSAWRELDAVLDAFDAAASIQGSPPPRPTLAHAPTPDRAAHPGKAGDPSLAMKPAAWSAFVDGIAEAVDRCRVRGYEPTFHPELGTDVEAPAEIEAMLAATEIGLCLDTGHFLAAGGDPVAAISAGRAGSTRSTSRTPVWIASPRSSGSTRTRTPSGVGACSAHWARATSTSRGCSRGSAVPRTRLDRRRAGSLPGDAATFEAAARAQQATTGGSWREAAMSRAASDPDGVRGEGEQVAVRRGSRSQLQPPPRRRGKSGPDQTSLPGVGRLRGRSSNLT